MVYVLPSGPATSGSTITSIELSPSCSQAIRLLRHPRRMRGPHRMGFDRNVQNELLLAAQPCAGSVVDAPLPGALGHHFGQCRTQQCTRRQHSAGRQAGGHPGGAVGARSLIGRRGSTGATFRIQSARPGEQSRRCRFHEVPARSRRTPAKPWKSTRRSWRAWCRRSTTPRGPCVRRSRRRPNGRAAGRRPQKRRD